MAIHLKAGSVDAPPAGALDATLVVRGKVAVLHVYGRIDTETIPRFAEAAGRAFDDGARYMVIDLAGVDFINSMGWGRIVALTHRFRAERGNVVLAGLRDHVRSVFEMLGLRQLVPCAPDALDALQYLTRYPLPASGGVLVDAGRLASTAGGDSRAEVGTA